jgi:hypothetical protein
MSQHPRKRLPCQICKTWFWLFKAQHNRICPECRTPYRMQAAGYGWQDIVVETNVSSEFAREVVFGRQLEKAS